MKNALPLIGLWTAMVLWASSFIALKIAFVAYHPMVVIFGRMLVGSICVLAVALKYRYTFSYKKGDYKLIAFMALCEPCLYFIFESQAIVYTTASQAGMITAMLPVLVMISASIVLGERSGISEWGGAVIAVAGVVWMTLENSPQQNAPNPILGNFFEFLAMVCAMGYTIAMRKLASRYSPFFLTAIQAFTGCIFFFPLLFLPNTQLPDQFLVVPTLAILYLGAVITIGAYGLYNYGLKYVSASRASALVNLIPVFCVILGWIVLGERLSVKQFLAAGLILAGVWLTQKPRRGVSVPQ